MVARESPIDALRAQQIARTLAMVTHQRLGADSQLAETSAKSVALYRPTSKLGRATRR